MKPIIPKDNAPSMKTAKTIIQPYSGSLSNVAAFSRVKSFKESRDYLNKFEIKIITYQTTHSDYYIRKNV